MSVVTMAIADQRIHANEEIYAEFHEFLDDETTWFAAQTTVGASPGARST